MLRRSLFSAFVLTNLAVFAQGQSAYIWDGSENVNWSEPLNWNLASGYPGKSSDEDTVTIPSTGRQPELNVNVTIKSLTMTDSGTDPVLTLNGGDLTVESHADDGVVIDANCRVVVKMDQWMEINLDGDAALDTGHIELNGEIILGPNGDSGSNRPELRFGEGVYYTTGAPPTPGAVALRLG